MLIVLAALYVQENSPVFWGFSRALLVWFLAFSRASKDEALTLPVTTDLEPCLQVQGLIHPQSLDQPGVFSWVRSAGASG